MRKVLIQLIGNQTLPNIFPILAICPDRVVNIYTNETENKHKKIKQWCKKYGEKFGINPEFADYGPVGVDMEDTVRSMLPILQCVIEQAIEKKDLLMLNMTGGTKPMAAFAISYCSQAERGMAKSGEAFQLPIFYVNTKSKKFEFMTHADLRGQILEHEEFSRKLNVAELIEAGSQTRVLPIKKDWKPLCPLAERLHQFAKNKQKFKMQDPKRDNMGEFVKLPISELLLHKDANKLEHDKQTIKELAAEVESNSEVGQALAMLDLECRHGDFYFSQDLQDAAAQKQKIDKEELMRRMQGACNFFVGGWWEVVVADAYQKQNPDSEVLWSVETAAEKDEKHLVETDIVATDGISLCCISCKRGLHEKVMQEIEQHCARTALLGGVMNERIMAIYQESATREIRFLLKALGLTLWTGESLYDKKKRREERKKMAANKWKQQMKSEPQPADTPASTPAPAPASASVPRQQKDEPPVKKRGWLARLIHACTSLRGKK